MCGMEALIDSLSMLSDLARPDIPLGDCQGALQRDTAERYVVSK